VQTGLPSSGQVRRALEEVYARPEFAPRQEPGVGSAVAQLWRRVKELLASLLPDVNVDAAAGRLLFWLLVALMVVVAAGVLLHLAGRLPAFLRLRSTAAPGAAAPGAARPTRAAEWEALSCRLAGERRWREAAIALYQALVLKLDERGAVRYDPAKTPGDYRREVKAREARRALDGFLRRFEPVAFGGRSLDGAGYEALRAAAGEALPRG
jgi:Domain of unknown function (DUF4129)